MSDIIEEGKEYLETYSGLCCNEDEILRGLITELEAAREVIKAATLLDKLKLIKDVRGKTDYYRENKPKAWLSLNLTIKAYNKAQGGKKENPIGESLAKEIHDQGLLNE